MMLRLLSLFGLLTPAVAIAQQGPGGGPGVQSMWATICSTLPFCNLGTGAPAFFAQRALNLIFPLIAISAVVLIIYAGIKIIVANGSDDGVSSAKEILKYALGGLILSILATAIISFVMNVVLPGFQ